jgi:hypothetical protein
MSCSVASLTSSQLDTPALMPSLQENAFAPAAPETVRTRNGIGERGGLAISLRIHSVSGADIALPLLAVNSPAQHKSSRRRKETGSLFTELKTESARFLPSADTDKFAPSTS